MADDDGSGRAAAHICCALLVTPVTEEQSPTSPRKRGGHGALSNRRKADLFAHGIAPIIAELRASGIVLPRAITDELIKRQVPTARGGAWHPTTVARLLIRLADTLSAAEYHAGTPQDHEKLPDRIECVSDSEYDRGAVRINFGSTMPLTATTEVAPGKAAFGRPDKVTKYDPPSQATNVVYANKKLAFTTTSGSKWKLTGDGISFTGQVDPRPSRPNIAFVKLNCK